MNLFFIFVELATFFIVYSFYGIVQAAYSLIFIAIFQLLIDYNKTHAISKSKLILFVVVTSSALMTATYSDAIFLQWKLTIVYAAFSIGLIAAKQLYGINLIKKLFGNKGIPVAEKTWTNINTYWSAFFMVNALVNIYIMKFCSLYTWVAFKSIWSTVVIIAFSFFTVFYLWIKIPKEDKEDKEDLYTKK